MYILMLRGIIPDEGAYIEDILIKEEWYFSAIFFIICAFAVINMLIGILCDVAARITANEKDARDIDLVQEKLLDILKASDLNGDGRISKVEFLNILVDSEALRALKQVGIDITQLADHADLLFDAVAEDGNAGER